MLHFHDFVIFIYSCTNRLIYEFLNHNSTKAPFTVKAIDSLSLQNNYYLSNQIQSEYTIHRLKYFNHQSSLLTT